jgi:hypothetical protein
MIFEMALVLTFVKPGWDAHQVATNAEQKLGSPLDPMMFMSYCKGVELFSETYPALLIQSVALVKSEEKSRAAMLSLFISACTAAMISTTIAYDK